jgi:type I restriction enzyme M protein
VRPATSGASLVRKSPRADAEDGLETPEEIASAIEGHLAAALEEVRALVEELGAEATEPAIEEAAE